VQSLHCKPENFLRSDEGSHRNHGRFEIVIDRAGVPIESRQGCAHFIRKRPCSTGTQRFLQRRRIGNDGCPFGNCVFRHLDVELESVRVIAITEGLDRTCAYRG